MSDRILVQGVAQLPPTAKRAMLASTLGLSVSRIYGAAISAVQGLLIARVLGPYLFGVYNLIYLVGWYVGLAHFGARDVAYREIPFLRGQRDAPREKLIRDVAITAEIVWRLACSILLGLSALWVRDSLLRNSLLLLALSLFVARLSELYNMLATVEQDFTLVSWVNALKLSVTFSVIAATIHRLGIYGSLIAPIFGSAVAIYFFRRRHPLAFTLRWESQEFRRVFKIGFPLALLTFVCWVYLNSDRTIVAAFLGRTDLGYYGIAVFLTLFLIQLPSDFITVLQPRLYRELGRQNELADLKDLIVNASRVFAYLSPLVILFLWVWVPPVMQFFLPHYGPSVPVIRILSLNLFFASALVMPYTILYSPGINRQTTCLLVWGGCAVLTAAAACGFLRLGWGISGAAVASVLGQATAAVAFFLLAHRYYSGWMGQDWRFYFELAVPIAYLGFVVAAVHYLGSDRSSSPLTLVAHTLFLGLVYVPCLVFFNRKTRMWNRIRMHATNL